MEKDYICVPSLFLVLVQMHTQQLKHFSPDILLLLFQGTTCAV